MQNPISKDYTASVFFRPIDRQNAASNQRPKDIGSKLEHQPIGLLTLLALVVKVEDRRLFATLMSIYIYEDRSIAVSFSVDVF